MSAVSVPDPDLLPPTRYTSDHKGVEDFRRSLEQEARWRQNLERADILWDFPPKASDGSGGMALAPKVKWIQTTSSGVGPLVKALGFQNSDLLVTTAGGVHAGPLAEFVFMGILVHQKRFFFLKEEQRARHWERYCGDDLAGKTLSIVGAGRVGRHVAMVGRCFGMRVVAADVEYREDQAAELGLDQLFAMDRLYEMLGQADVVILCIPHTPATEGVISMEAFNAMKDGVVFANISRGQVVDEIALISVIHKSHDDRSKS